MVEITPLYGNQHEMQFKFMQQQKNITTIKVENITKDIMSKQEMKSFLWSKRTSEAVWRIQICGIHIISLDPDPYQKMAGSRIRIRIK